MNWDAFQVHGHSYRAAFEIFSTQLFERHIFREYFENLSYYTAVDGAGGDGGLEAYAELHDGTMVGLQAKWFRTAITTGQFKQIEDSIHTAMKNHPSLRQYIIAVPRDVSPKKITKGNKSSTGHEEERANTLTAAIKATYPKLKLIWWRDSELLKQIQLDEGGIQRYWFQRSSLSAQALKERFALQVTNSWLKTRYAADLNGQGKIAEVYDWSLLGPDFCARLTELTEKAGKKINDCRVLIAQFLATEEVPDNLRTDLQLIDNNIGAYQNKIELLTKAIAARNTTYRYQPLAEVSVWETHLALKKFLPTNIQLPLVEPLSKSLERLHKLHISQYLESLSEDFQKRAFVVFGNAGTGKTQGLAHSVKTHLQTGQPAVIIQAKGTPNQNWSTLLASALELEGWNKGDLFAALEAMAISWDRRHEGLQLGTALICIDGLEEDQIGRRAWYDRISECSELCKKHSRLRFIFSARKYFKTNEMEEHGIFELIDLPTQGDISISAAARIYFKPVNFNIRLDNHTVISRIDSLLTLKLFCERYQGRRILHDEPVSTLQRELLNAKAERLDNEFAPGKQWIRKALPVIATDFYRAATLKHDDLVETLKPVLRSTDTVEIDRLLEFLAENAVLVKSFHDSDDLLPIEHIYYHVAYQSFIEHFITEHTVDNITKGKITAVPDIFFSGMVRPFESDDDDRDFRSFPAETMLLNLFRRLFKDTSKLIGVNEYLSQGMSATEILNYQLAVLCDADKEKARPYQKQIDTAFDINSENRYIIFKDLILPTSANPEAPFGSNYFHEIMLKQPSVFERDSFLWGQTNGRGLELQNDKMTIELALAMHERGFNPSLFSIGKSEKHNGLPLILAWCLSALDQNFRDTIRKSLATWARHNCDEFVLLLTKMIPCNDPQIWEDFAAITQGLANHLRDNKQILQLAQWSIQHIFIDKIRFRSVIIRNGFRAIVEKAHDLKLINKTDVLKCRPKRDTLTNLLPLDLAALNEPGEAFYPIKSDLAWYVIKEAYQGFFEHNYPYTEDADIPAEVSLLKRYADHYGLKDLRMHQWTLAAAVAYIKSSLGLTRNSGNNYSTRHGIKGNLFTYEEKYTWLAVTYLQGYVAGLLPYHTGFIVPQYLESYDLITNLPDTYQPDIKLTLPNFMRKADFPDWIIPEDLSPTVKSVTDPSSDMERHILGEPILKLSEWLHYDTKFIALWQHTLLYDKHDTYSTRLIAPALVIKTSEFPFFRETLLNRPEDIGGIRSVDHLHAATDTDTYANPADIVWMNRIGEIDEMVYCKRGLTDIPIYKATVQVVNNERGEEKYHYLPSKKLRKMLGIKRLEYKSLIGPNKKETGVLFTAENDDRSNQQTAVFVDRDALEKSLLKRGLTLFWLVEVYRRTSLPFEKKPGTHYQRCRKYLIWEDQGSYHTEKYWDETFSNQRDSA